MKDEPNVLELRFWSCMKTVCLNLTGMSKKTFIWNRRRCNTKKQALTCYKNMKIIKYHNYMNCLQNHIVSGTLNRLFWPPAKQLKLNPTSSQTKNLFQEKRQTKNKNYFDRVFFVDAGPRVLGIASERNFERFQKGVHAGEQTLWRGRQRLHRRHTLEHNDSIGQISGHYEIVLDHKRRLFAVPNKSLDHFGGMQPLLRVQIGGRLVDQIDIGRLAKTNGQSHSLQLATGQVADLLVDDVVDLQRFEHVRVELGMRGGVAYPHMNELTNCALELGTYLLGLVGNVQFGHLGVTVRVQIAGEHANQSGLAGAVLAKQYNYFRVCERAALDLERKVAKIFAHVRIGVVVQAFDVVFL
ncbi:hypothetical protein BpHYR1_026732 [Brachionus plicatilis]|uniref:Uncharacterized protein n=1 Tax=Brachionus plicatilis TaxID=10195 RepID=A0A3M7RFL9_BRAPC|nr:hypothetical protein BpHYR1_026732 [Brachionus plicatilis]